MTNKLTPECEQRIRDVIVTGPFGEHVGMSVDELEVDRVVIRMPDRVASPTR